MDILDRRLRALASDVLGRATVSSTTPDAFKIAVAGGALHDRQGPALCRRAARRKPWRASADPAKRVFDALLAEAAVRRPAPLCDAALSAQPAGAARPTGRIWSISTSGTAR